MGPKRRKPQCTRVSQAVIDLVRSQQRSGDSDPPLSPSPTDDGHAKGMRTHVTQQVTQPRTEEIEALGAAIIGGEEGEEGEEDFLGMPNLYFKHVSMENLRGRDGFVGLPPVHDVNVCCPWSFRCAASSGWLSFNQSLCCLRHLLILLVPRSLVPSVCCDRTAPCGVDSTPACSRRGAWQTCWGSRRRGLRRF